MGLVCNVDLAEMPVESQKEVVHIPIDIFCCQVKRVVVKSDEVSVEMKFVNYEIDLDKTGLTSSGMLQDGKIINSAASLMSFCCTEGLMVFLEGNAQSG